MLSYYEFVRQSLETHLFFARIMKEHAFFLQIGFTPRDAKFAQHADELRMAFDELLAEAVALSIGVVGPDLLQSGEVITKYTLEAERVSVFYTSVPIATEITESEHNLSGGTGPVNQMLVRRVSDLNRKALSLLDNIIQFKSTVLTGMLECKMFTVNYPLLIDHIMREAKLYQKLIWRLHNREEVNLQREAFEQEYFWNRIMAEHSKFIRGLLDPSEDELISTANDFGNEFDQLTQEAKEALDSSRQDRYAVTEDSLRATEKLRDFKAQGTEGILDCKVRSIIIPLLGDHTIREANHFLRLLRIFKEM